MFRGSVMFFIRHLWEAINFIREQHTGRRFGERYHLLVVPTGTGKSTKFVVELLKSGKYDKIVVVIPTVTACSNALGFLPWLFSNTTGLHGVTVSAQFGGKNTWRTVCRS
eukprot:GHVL01021204.1.p3 GENE.GHVL01021204.1~~GHVL01021204.1.p3  ORF type:complete len:110 (-),score=0.50 GHVL01021204.1:1233-1562(-)